MLNEVQLLSRWCGIVGADSSGQNELTFFKRLVAAKGGGSSPRNEFDALNALVDCENRTLGGTGSPSGHRNEYEALNQICFMMEVALGGTGSPPRNEVQALYAICDLETRLAAVSSYHADALSWRTRVVANGGTVSNSTMASVSTFCTSISTLRTKFFRLNLRAGDQLAAALTPLYLGDGTSTFGNATDTNSLFVATDYVERGYQGGLTQSTIQFFQSGVTPPAKSLDTGIDLSTLGSANLSIGLWQGENWQAAGSAQSPFGAGFAPFPYIYSDTIGKIYGYYGGFGGADFIQGSTGYGNGFIVFSRTAANATAIYKNGTSIGSTASTSSTTPSSGSLTFLSGNANGSWSCGDFVAKGLTSGEVATLYNAFLAFQSSLTRANVGVIKFACCGDSLVAGYNGATPWPTILSQSWAGKFLNLGVVGEPILGGSSVTGQYPQDIKPSRPDDTYYTKALSIYLVGSNDFVNGATGLDVYNAHKALWATSRSDGFKVVPCTVPNRGDAGWTGLMNTQRIAFNSLLVSDSSLFDGFVDIDNLFPDPNDLTIMQADKIHPNSAGNALIASEFVNVINPATI